MHGHLQYECPEFWIVEYLNGRILNSPSPIGLENELDFEYFTNKNEIRQRMIPLVKQYLDTGQITYDEVYQNSDFWIRNIL